MELIEVDIVLEAGIAVEEDIVLVEEDIVVAVEEDIVLAEVDIVLVEVEMEECIVEAFVLHIVVEDILEH